MTDVAVGKGRNAFGVDPVADKEVSLDVQVVAGVAPQARIAIYFTQADEQGFVDGIAQAVHDKRNAPSVVVVTWGEPEVFWPPQARKALDAVLADAVQLGVTVVAAAGDELATEQMNNGKAHVDYPASSPYVLACGGTTITLDAAGTAIADEVVWNDQVNAKGTGGGISTLFKVPAFQKNANVPPSVSGGRKGRGVPDVAAAAAETNGYRVFVDGEATVASGTSAVAPLWGALVTLVNAQRSHSAGHINPFLYEHPELLRVITKGDNISPLEGIGYAATDGWSACTGLGVPKGADLIRALAAMP
jgi:kumamolisin